ncbi:amino acid ABC transporter ATP-binding protein [Trichococcus collinsii]|uniref:amino acid ABC transporter ATP-binding protein n=1 Tax=Trichococcus collinsii TaxID=157076 RepID=UPI000B363D3B|nr:amino acid ABC transporter ATP-binding protein [Trichococcus collinsii]
MESPILTLKHVNKYYGEIQALADIQLDVAKGEVVTIIGQSGCGKSTVLRCINGLEGIQSGSILLDGKEIAAAGTNWKEVRQKIGMVFQKYDLFPHMTVLDNVLLAPLKVQKRKKDEAAEEAIALLKRVGLEDKAYSFPRQLSGGQQQRVAIVRALMTHPEIMLFDEVTAALDPEMIREVLNVILDLAKDGMTMLIVTHEMAFAEAVSDKIVFMEKGNIVEVSDDPTAFFKQPQSQRANEFINTFRFQ